MDEARKIRFLYPPVFFTLAVGLAGKLDPDWSLRHWLQRQAGDDSIRNLGLLAAAGLTLVSVGFAIGTGSVSTLRLIAVLTRSRSYDSTLCQNRKTDVWSHLCGKGEPSETDLPYLAAAIGHELVSDGMKQWLERRWNAFNLSLHSGIALLLAIPAIAFCGFRPGCWWFILVPFGSLMFIGMAAFAWVDTYHMNNMLARTRLRKPEAERDEKE